MNKNKKKNKELINLLLKIGSVVLILFLLFTFVFGIKDVRTNNMHPMVNEGDLVFCYRLVGDLNSGDVAVLKHGEETVLGRVIAKEGDTVSFTDNGRVLVNDMPLGYEVYYEAEPNKDANIEYPLTIEDGKYFILSDYCTESDKDSRTFGTVSNEDVEGRLILLLRRRGF
ncbi:MAG: signal peptidase I [Acutalibacteraceae bacterium]|nr:signal peptidase I [Acutalibacteraceae bacterium]